MTEKTIRTVLLIDDDEDDNFYNRIIIEKAGVAERIEVFQYAEEALIYLKQCDVSDVDLIFLDINMPRMNGFQFMEKYSELEKCCQAKIIIVMLTTSLNPSDEDRCKAFKDIGEFRTKPLTEEMLQEVVRAYF